MLLALLEGSLVDCPIGINPFTLSLDLAIEEFTLVTGAIFHKEDTLALLLAIIIVTLVLEVRVLESVNAFTVPQLGYRVDITHVSLYN